MTRIAIAGILSSFIVPQWAIAATAQGTDPLQYSGSAWSPYLAGALIGLLAVATLYFSDKPLGASTAYARMAGILGNMLSRQHRITEVFSGKQVQGGLGGHGCARGRAWCVSRRMAWT